MPKKIIYFFLTILTVVAVISPAFTASAYEITGFEVSAEAGMLVSMDTGEILYEKDLDIPIYPASITKIMTVTLMLESEKYDPAGKVTMSKEVDRLITGTGSAVSNLKIG